METVPSFFFPPIVMVLRRDLITVFQKDDGGGINEPTGVSGSGNEVCKALSNFVDSNFLPLGKVSCSLFPIQLK